MAKKATSNTQLYREDLASVHIDGYGFHWESAAPTLLCWLREFGVETGRVVDLGCGGGQWLACLAAEGYDTYGIDVSRWMIREARRNAPRTKFVCASFAEAEIPECDAVTSLGEPLNYLNSGPLMQRTIRNVFESLRSGGVFVFDVRHPPTGRVEPINHNLCGADWFCHALIEEDANQLTRHITTFRRVGKHFRRDHETHRLKLFSKTQMLQWLRKVGFRVRTLRGYGDYELKKRQSVFICRKP